MADGADQSELRLTHRINQSKTTYSTDQFLTVNEQGDVVKARYQLRINRPSEWSDKVFEPTYKLQPLSSVESYVQSHGHLPGIPSADQVVKDGVDLVRINATLLEKVEELTLYSIPLEKAEQQKQQKIQALEQKQDELERMLLSSCSGNSKLIPAESGKAISVLVKPYY